MRKMILSEDHPSIGDGCPACDVLLAAGAEVTLVPIGPGSDPEEQAKARAGGPYTAVAILAHWDCAGGVE